MEDKDRYNAGVSYVEVNDKNYKGKSLSVNDFDNHFRVNLLDNVSHLVLSKAKLNK